jgi:hypothetical protein
MADEVNQRRSRNRELTPWADIEAAAPIAPAPAAPSSSEPQFPQPWDLGDRPSRARPAPLDHHGIPFMTNHEVGNIFGVGRNNSKGVSYSAIPQFIEHKGQGARDTTRTWFSKSDVVDHLASLLKSGKGKEGKAAAQARWGGMHKQLSTEVNDAKATLQERRNNGENPGHLFNQEHPDHRNIHLRMEVSHGGRIQPLGEQTAGKAFGSSLGGARASGNLIPVGEGPDLPGPKRGRTRP